MAIQGLRNTGITGGGTGNNDFVADARPKNWREGVLLLYPNGRAPLFALSSAMKSKAVDDPEFSWWEKPLSAQRVALGASINNTDVTTALNIVANAKSIPVGALLRSEESGEIMRVTAITADSGAGAITVTRGVSGSTKTAITYNGAGVNPNLLCIGTAFEEGSSSPDGLSFDPTKRYNFTQIFRNNLELTRTAEKTRLRTGDQVREAKRECLEIHSVEIEKAAFFGKRYETTLNGKPLRTTGGFLETMLAEASSNVVSAETNMQFDDLEEHLRKMFAYGSEEKVGFCGNVAALNLQRCCRLAKNVAWNIQTGQKEFGMNVSRLISPFGTLVLKTHPLFNQMTGGTTGGSAYNSFESWLFVIDMENIEYRYFKGDDTRYIPKQETPGLDGMKSGYLTECGMAFLHPTTHYILKNITSVAAES